MCRSPTRFFPDLTNTGISGQLNSHENRCQIFTRAITKRTKKPMGGSKGPWVNDPEKRLGTPRELCLRNEPSGWPGRVFSDKASFVYSRIREEDWAGIEMM
jgi:hypothetical protein